MAKSKQSRELMVAAQRDAAVKHATSMIARATEAAIAKLKNKLRPASSS